MRIKINNQGVSLPNHVEVNDKNIKKFGTTGRSFSFAKKITRGVANEVYTFHNIKKYITVK